MIFISIAGEYDPHSADGQRLIAHEAVHTVQQAGSAPRTQHKLEVSSPGDAHEIEADSLAEKMVAPQPAEWETGHRPSFQPRSMAPAIQRIPQTLSPDIQKQLKEQGRGELDDLIDKIVPNDNKFHNYKTINRDGVEHVWEIKSSSSMRTVDSTFAGAMAPKDVPEDGGKRIRHQKLFFLNLVPDPTGATQGKIDPETVFHELVHMRISIDKDLPEGEQSSFYGEYAQQMALATDPALGIVTQMTDKTTEVRTAIDNLRNLFTSEIDPKSTTELQGAQATDKVLERLLNEKYTNQTASKAFKSKDKTNATIARRYAASTRSSMEETCNAARVSEYKRLLSTIELERLTKALETALVALFDHMDQQQQIIQNVKKNGFPSKPANTSDPMEPRPVDIGGKPVPPP